MKDIKKYTNLSPCTIYNIRYNRFTDYEKFRYVNSTNKINTFNLNYVTKQKPIYQIESNSYQYSDPTFSIEKTENISFDKSNGEILNSSKINKTVNYNIRTKEKEYSEEPKFNTYNNLNISSDKSKNIKIITQRSDGNILSSINKSTNSSLMDEQISDSVKVNKQKVTKNVNTSPQNEGNENFNLASSATIRPRGRDENEFLNSINKTSILNIRLTSTKDDKYNNLPQTYDERGYIYNSNATYFDNDGDFYDENGFDKHKGRHDRFGDYKPGPGFNKEIGMYTEDINNLSFSEEQLKKEIEEKEKLEFEKIKLEAKESKKLKKDFLLPIEKDDSSDDFDYQEEFEKLEQEGISDIEPEENINLKEQNKNNGNNKDIATRFFNGEFNDDIEKNLKLEEDGENKINIKIKKNDEPKNEDINNKIKNQFIDNKDLKNNKEDKTLKKTKENNKSKDNVNTRQHSTKDKKSVNKNSRKNSNNQKNNKKRKSKNNSPNNEINENQNLKSEEEDKKIKKTPKFKLPFSKTPEITEESINNESNFEDIERYINWKKKLTNYNDPNAENYEYVQMLDNVVKPYVELMKNKKH